MKKIIMVFLVFLFALTQNVNADEVVDWNKISVEILAKEKPLAVQYEMVAAIQTAVWQAVKEANTKNVSIPAAVAAVNHCILDQHISDSGKLALKQHYDSALSKVSSGASKNGGIEVGRKYGLDMLKTRNFKPIPLAYKPKGGAGEYVPTTLPVGQVFLNQSPWVLSSPSQFRAPPPPKLSSQKYAKDFNEVKKLGAMNSSARTAEQSEKAKFWQAVGPVVYTPIIRSAANGNSQRTPLDNARLLAATGQGMNDAMIAVFDGKYKYEFWRPITAIRNADKDKNRKTEMDSSWKPFIPTPMHPEYPCAHCIVSATAGEIMRREFKTDAVKLEGTSPKLPGKTRRWNTISDFVQEVTDARIYDGVHYRTSGTVAQEMGKKVAALVAKKFKL